MSRLRIDRLFQQLIPIIGWVTTVQHAPEHLIRIGFAVVSTFGICIIHPGQNDDLACRVIAEKQPVLLKKFYSEPMLVLIAKRAPLAVFRACWILRNDLKSQPDNCSQTFAGILFDIVDRVFLFKSLDLLCQIIKLRKKAWVSKNRPAIYSQGC